MATLRPTDSGAPRATGIARAQMPAILIGVLGLIGAAIGFFTNAPEFFRAWLPAYLFWFLIAAGSLAVLMLQYVTGGAPLAAFELDVRRAVFVELERQDAHAPRPQRKQREVD